MGRHAADDGAAVHPLVAAALEARQTGARGSTTAGSHGEGGLGWPGSPSEGDGLGWPDSTEEPSAPADPAVGSAPEQRTSVWRRLFGSAERARQGTSAA